MNGGSFSNDIDGGAINTNLNIYNDLLLNLSQTFLYETGNMYPILSSGYGYSAYIETGTLYRFHKINISDTLFLPENIEKEQVFKLFPSEDYTIFDSQNNIIFLHKTGNFPIIGVSGILPNNQTKTINIQSFNSDTLKSFYNIINVNPITTSFDISPQDNLLYVYNLNSQESIDIKNYYFQMRTGVSGANILGINCDLRNCLSGYYIDTGNYINNIRIPIHRHIITGQKPIKFVCLLHGIPLFVTGQGGYIGGGAPIGTGSGLASPSVLYDLSTSLAYISGYGRRNFTRPYYRADYMNWVNDSNINNPFMFEEYSGNLALFCAIASLSGKTENVSGYIRKICQDGIVDGPFLKGSGQNTTFLCYSDAGTGYIQTGYILNAPYNQFERTLDFYSGLGVNVFASKVRVEFPRITGINVGGFTSDGWHSNLYTGGTGENSVDTLGGLWESFPNNCTLSGYNWYLSSHYESFAGDMVLAENSFSHSPFSRHIRPNALGGTNYSNIPVAFVGSMTEPFYLGIAKVRMFDAWFNGRTFIESAYIGLNATNYAIMGDPLLKWR